jgi:hypothetical protein
MVQKIVVGKWAFIAALLTGAFLLLLFGGCWWWLGRQLWQLVVAAGGLFHLGLFGLWGRSHPLRRQCHPCALTYSRNTTVLAAETHLRRGQQETVAISIQPQKAGLYKISFSVVGASCTKAKGCTQRSRPIDSAV